MSFWDGVFLTSFFWLVVCVLAILGTAIWALDQDNLIGWSKGFSDGWGSAVETAMRLLNEQGRGKEAIVIQNEMK